MNFEPKFITFQNQKKYISVHDATKDCRFVGQHGGQPTD